MARLVHRDGAEEEEEEEEGRRRRRRHDNNYQACNDALVHDTIDMKVTLMPTWPLKVVVLLTDL